MVETKLKLKNVQFWTLTLKCQADIPLERKTLALDMKEILLRLQNSKN